jgi:acyl transferase domain-containing protein
VLEPTPAAVLFPGHGSQRPATRELVAAFRPDLTQQVGQIVLSGSVDALAEAEAAAAEGLRTVELDVAGAFRSPQTQDAFCESRAEMEFREPRVPVVSCPTALPFVDPREELTAALVRPIRRRETTTALAGRRVQAFVDAGPGRAVAKLAPRHVPGAGPPFSTCRLETNVPLPGTLAILSRGAGVGSPLDAGPRAEDDRS